MNKMACVLALSVAACSSSATDIGDVTVGAQSYHIEREGAEPAAGVSTQMVVKPNGSVKPDSVLGWVGLATDPATAKTAGKYDPNDGDFDIDLTCPSPLETGSQFFFDVSIDGVVMTGSIDFK